jgi:hypothetical protein
LVCPQRPRWKFETPDRAAVGKGLVRPSRSRLRRSARIRLASRRVPMLRRCWRRQSLSRRASQNGYTEITSRFVPTGWDIQWSPFRQSATPQLYCRASGPPVGAGGAALRIPRREGIAEARPEGAPTRMEVLYSEGPRSPSHAPSSARARLPAPGRESVSPISPRLRSTRGDSSRLEWTLEDSLTGGTLVG